MIFFINDDRRIINSLFCVVFTFFISCSLSIKCFFFLIFIYSFFFLFYIQTILTTLKMKKLLCRSPYPKKLFPRPGPILEVWDQVYLSYFINYFPLFWFWFFILHQIDGFILFFLFFYLSCNIFLVFSFQFLLSIFIFLISYWFHHFYFSFIFYNCLLFDVLFNFLFVILYFYFYFLCYFSLSEESDLEELKQSMENENIRALQYKQQQQQQQNDFAPGKYEVDRMEKKR